MLLQNHEDRETCHSRVLTRPKLGEVVTLPAVCSNPHPISYPSYWLVVLTSLHPHRSKFSALRTGGRHDVYSKDSLVCPASLASFTVPQGPSDLLPTRNHCQEEEKSLSLHYLPWVALHMEDCNRNLKQQHLQFTARLPDLNSSCSALCFQGGSSSSTLQMCIHQDPALPPFSETRYHRGSVSDWPFLTTLLTSPLHTVLGRAPY